MASSEADYIVVGGGLSGCVIASRLGQSATKPEVVLIEAGPHSDKTAASGFLSGLSLLGSDLDYAYQSQPISNTYGRSHTLNAGKCLEGGSMLNYVGWLHADAADYDEWAEVVGDSRWSYEGLNPWLRKAEDKTYIVPIGAAEGGERQYRLRDPVKQAWIELGVTPNLQKEHGTIGGLTEMLENSLEGSGSHRMWCTHSMGSRMLSKISPAAQLKEHNIPIVHNSQHVGQNLHDHFVLYLAFRLRDPSQGYALGNAAWGQDPALSKSLHWDWMISQSLPAELLVQHQPSATEKQKKRNLCEYLVPLSRSSRRNTPGGLEPLTPDSSDEAIEERIRRTGTQQHHSGGTVAMEKVVDAEGKVLGVKGLRVADASIIPLSLGGHPQATLYAMAEQIASMIIAGT